MGIFSPQADLIYDINLLVQSVLVALLVLGWINSKSYKTHGTIMATATLIQIITIVTIMVPSLVLNLGALVPFEGKPGQIITIVHSTVGTIAVILGCMLSLKFLKALRNTEPLSCGVKETMYATLSLWLLSFLGGFVFYIYYYL
ncbi:MAG: hypothetical protein GF309_08430 [Candidatus Lokiarchaeota archaeon]|nr:hypothetical protein [Candidatus Lokiarchaeota archaeon]